MANDYRQQLIEQMAEILASKEAIESALESKGMDPSTIFSLYADFINNYLYSSSELSSFLSKDEVDNLTIEFDSSVLKIKDGGVDVALLSKDVVDRIIDLESKMTSLQSSVSTLVNSLDGDVTEVIDTFNEIQSFLNGYKNSDTLYGLIQPINASIDGINEKLDRFIGKLVSYDAKLTNYGTAVGTYLTLVSSTQQTALDTLLNLLTLLTTTDTRLTNMRDQIEGFRDTLNTAVGNLESSKREIDEKIATVNELSGNVEGFNQTISDMNTAIDTFKSDVNAHVEDVCTALTEAMAENASTLNNRMDVVISELSNVKAGSNANYDTVNASINLINTTINTLLGTDKANETINTFQEVLDFLDNVKDTSSLSGMFNDVYAYTDASVRKIREEFSNIQDNISQSLYTTQRGLISEMQTISTDIDQKINTLQLNVDNLDTESKEYADTQDVAVKQELNAAIDTKIAEVKSLISGDNTSIDSSVSTLETLMTEANEAINQIKADIVNLFTADAEANDGKINMYSEIVSFLEGVSDASTLLGLLEALKAEVNGKSDNDKAELAASINVANSSIEANTASIEALNKKVLVADAETSGINTLVEVTNFLEGIDETSKLATMFSEKDAELRTAINDKGEEAKSFATGLNNDLKAHIDSSYNIVDWRLSQLDRFDDTVTNKFETINVNMAALAKSADVNALVGTINSSISRIDSEIQTIKDGLSTINADDIISLNADLSVVNASVNALFAKDEETDDKLAELENVDSSLADEIQNVKSELNATVNEKEAALAQSLADVSNNLDDFMGEVQLTVSNMNSSINAKFETIDSSVNALNTKIDTLIGAENGDADNVINTFKEMESFLQDISDEDSLTGMMASMKQTITDEYTTADSSLKQLLNTFLHDLEVNVLAKQVAYETTLNASLNDNVVTPLLNAVNAMQSGQETNTNNIATLTGRVDAAETAINNINDKNEAIIANTSSFVDGKIAGVEQMIADGDSSVVSYFNNIIDDLDNDINSLVLKDEAIIANTSALVDGSINEVYEYVDGKVDNVDAKVETLFNSVVANTSALVDGSINEVYEYVDSHVQNQISLVNSDNTAKFDELYDLVADASQFAKEYTDNLSNSTEDKFEDVNSQISEIDSSVKSIFRSFDSLVEADLNGTIDRFKEVENFLAEVKDSSTLTGMLQTMESSLKQYADGGDTTLDGKITTVDNKVDSYILSNDAALDTMSSEIYQTIADVSAAADGYYEDMIEQLTQSIENVSTKQDLAREELFDYVKTSDTSLLNAILDASKHAEDLDAATNTRIDTVEAEINQNIADTSADIHLAINNALATSSANLLTALNAVSVSDSSVARALDASFNLIAAVDNVQNTSIGKLDSSMNTIFDRYNTLMGSEDEKNGFIDTFNEIRDFIDEYSDESGVNLLNTLANLHSTITAETNNAIQSYNSDLKTQVMSMSANSNQMVEWYVKSFTPYTLNRQAMETQILANTKNISDALGYIVDIQSTATADRETANTKIENVSTRVQALENKEDYTGRVTGVENKAELNRLNIDAIVKDTWNETTNGAFVLKNNLLAYIDSSIKALDVAEVTLSSAQEGPSVSFKYSETDGIVSISNLTTNDLASAAALQALTDEVGVASDAQSGAAATGLKARLESLETLMGASSVDALITSKVESLDATVTKVEDAKNLVSVKVDQTNGVLSDVSVGVAYANSEFVKENGEENTYGNIDITSVDGILTNSDLAEIKEFATESAAKAVFEASTNNAGAALNPDTNDFQIANPSGIALGVDLNNTINYLTPLISAAQSSANGKIASLMGDDNYVGTAMVTAGQWQVSLTQNAKDGIVGGNTATTKLAGIEGTVTEAISTAVAAVKKEILTGESNESLDEAYDTLLEVSKWIDSSTGDIITNLNALNAEVGDAGDGENDPTGLYLVIDNALASAKSYTDTKTATTTVNYTPASGDDAANLAADGTGLLNDSAVSSIKSYVDAIVTASAETYASVTGTGYDSENQTAPTLSATVGTLKSDAIAQIKTYIDGKFALLEASLKAYVDAKDTAYATMYSLTSHGHDAYYSFESHTHDAYSLTSHNHDDSYSMTSHTHDDYSLASHTHAYSLTSHSHDDYYSLTSHVHDDYSLTSHNHDEVYSLTNHDHSIYSLNDHSHSDYYSLTSHAHDLYYTAVTPSQEPGE